MKIGDRVSIVKHKYNPPASLDRTGKWGFIVDIIYGNFPYLVSFGSPFPGRLDAERFQKDELEVIK